MKNFFFHFYKTSDRQARSGKAGFTLVEMLVSIMILVVASTGAYAAAQTGITTASYARNEMIATYLAQEGVEVIRHYRDQNGLAGSSWLTSIANVSSDPCYPGKVCSVNVVTNAIVPCATTCEYLRLSPVDGNGLSFYGYNSSWDLTSYRRQISLTLLNSHEANLRVEVSWLQGAATRSIVVQETILNWP